MGSRLALGTVQFGLPYGVANQAGQASPLDAAAIVERAWQGGIDTLDTAAAYGESEQRLGEIGVGRWRVISKLPAVLEEHCEDVAAWVKNSVVASLNKLKIARLGGVLAHRSYHLMGRRGAGLRAALSGLQAQGLVEKIGVSIYDPGELDVLWPHFRPDLVQAPFSVVDRRLLSSGWLARLYEAGTEVHVRSAFLQGLLLMGPARRPKTFERWQVLWDSWDRWLQEQCITPLQACLGFAASRPEISRIVVGVDTLEHLDEILLAAKYPGILPPPEIMSEDRDLVEPSRWNVRK